MTSVLTTHSLLVFRILLVQNVQIFCQSLDILENIGVMSLENLLYSVFNSPEHKFIMLINVKMPTIVGILIFMRMKIVGILIFMSMKIVSILISMSLDNLFNSVLNSPEHEIYHAHKC